MQTQPQVTFDDLPIDDRVRATAYDHIDELERAYGRITGCHVVIAQPHRHHQQGGLYSVSIDLVVPGGEIVVNREHSRDHAHEDVYVAMRDAFLAARRRLEDHTRRIRGDTKTHGPRPRGHVSQIFPLKGYGFIKTSDGRDVYFHRHAFSDQDYRLVDIGSEVFFTEEEGDDGPQAAHVQLVHHQRAPRS
jgi:cold shock CspA family protein/ribosome-associated translation inhibitor RaiA